jgi:1-acyl-sn-glycerol-3-phosphate acyltransferase
MKKAIPLLALIFTTVSLSVVALVLSPFDRKGDRVNSLGRLWAALHLKVCGIKVSLEGMENVSEPPYIFMCNHQSALDIFALLSSLGLPFKWMAKKELFLVPFLGWALKIGKNIAIDRKNPRKALRSIQEAARRLQEGSNIVIFPEGTWSKDGDMLPFKKGGFSLALRTGTPIVPVGIAGTGPLQPEGCYVPKGKGRIHIRLGTPVQVTDNGRASKTVLMHEVRDHIERLRKAACKCEETHLSGPGI